MLVGDAGRHANTLSGGGIESGMIGGKTAGTLGDEGNKKNKFDIY